MKKNGKINKILVPGQNLSKNISKKPGKVKFILTGLILTFGLALMPTGFVLANVVQERIDEGIKEQVEVPHPHNSKFEEWESNDYEDAPEIYTKYYMWNLTNPEGFLAGNKPIYEQVGPFVFRELKYKYDVKFSDDKEEVSFKEYSNYVQIGGENISKVMITNINPGFLGGVATAGGTELQYNQLNFPIVLSQLKDQFSGIYSESMESTLNDHDWIESNQEEILEDCETIGIGAWLSTKTVAEIFLGCITTEVLETFLRNGMPSWEDVFYAEWANDTFPSFNGNYNYLASQVEYTGGGIEGVMEGDIEDLMRQTLNDNDIRQKMNAIITKQGAGLVDLSGSASGVGIDVEYNLYGETVGSETDLNIVNSTVVQGSDYYERFWEIWLFLGVDMYLDTYIVSGGSGLTNAQCIALWNKSNPFSLTGMDYEANKIWFDAADKNDIESKNILKTEFGIDDTQLTYILKWINVSTTTWEPNAVEYTLNNWNAGVITTRTVEEWLYTANDTAISNYMAYYGKDPNRSKVNIFDDCQNTLEAEESKTPSCKIKTGRNDVNEVGQYIEYESQDTIYLWNEPEDVEGTNGMQFAPGVTQETKLKTFQPDLMRVAELEYDENVEIYDIDLLRFKMKDDTFAVNPNYYMNTKGLINLKPIEKYQGIDVRVSKPHFLDADPTVQYGIIGAKPDGNAHDTYIDVEPNTGLVMNARKRIQINFELAQTEYYMTNISNIVMPIVWLEQKGEIPEDLAEDFKEMLYSALELKENLPIWCLGLGLCITGPSAGLSAYQVKKRRVYNKISGLKEQKLLKPKLDDIKQKLGMNPQEPGNIEISKSNPDKPLA